MDRPKHALDRAAAALAAGLLLALAGCGTTPDARSDPAEAALDGSEPIVRHDFVAYVRQERLPWQPLDHIPGIEARVLSANPTLGRYAAVARVPAGFRADDARDLSVTAEFYVLEGDLRFGAEALGPRDFAFVPPGVPLPALASTAGATMLVFYTPSHPDAAVQEAQRTRGAYVVRDADAAWRPGTVGTDAGVPLELEIKDLKNEPLSGARTFLVRMRPGVRIPWERHSVFEEGYLLEGDFTLAECLPIGTAVGTYRPGGYFHRPPGLVHSGPRSGTRRGATWLIRTPAALDAEFFGGCEQGRGLDPIGTPPPAR